VELSYLGSSKAKAGNTEITKFTKYTKTQKKFERFTFFAFIVFFVYLLSFVFPLLTCVRGNQSFALTSGRTGDGTTGTPPNS
jgi:hypothetical protein